MGYQCCFCGASIQDNHPLEMCVRVDEEASQTFYCHGACLASALDASVPMAFPGGDILIPLGDEGTDVWRPVPARKIGERSYQISDGAQVPSDEEWVFLPGAAVLCELRSFPDGTVALVAVAEVESRDASGGDCT